MSAPCIILVFIAIFLPKIIEIGGHLTKFWQNNFAQIFWRHGSINGAALSVNGANPSMARDSYTAGFRRTEYVSRTDSQLHSLLVCYMTISSAVIRKAYTRPIMQHRHAAPRSLGLTNYRIGPLQTTSDHHDTDDVYLLISLEDS